jgi:hypothetical protein
VCLNPAIAVEELNPHILSVGTEDEEIGYVCIVLSDVLIKNKG